MITDKQKSQFEVFGFLVVKQMFSPEEIEIITTEFESVMLEDRNGLPYDGKSRQTTENWFRRRESVEFLETDERIHGPIKRLLGDGYTYRASDANLYIGNTGWHPDMGWDPSIPEGMNDPQFMSGNRANNHYHPSIKVAFYLDSVTEHTGSLRVIPGSHKNPYHDQLWSLHLDVPVNASAFDDVPPRLLKMWEQSTGSKEGGEQFLSDPDENHFGLSPNQIPSYSIQSEPGDAVFFSHQLWHASFGGKVGRRMFTLNFAAKKID